MRFGLRYFSLHFLLQGLNLGRPSVGVYVGELAVRFSKMSQKITFRQIAGVTSFTLVLQDLRLKRIEAAFRPCQVNELGDITVARFFDAFVFVFRPVVGFDSRQRNESLTTESAHEHFVTVYFNDVLRRIDVFVQLDMTIAGVEF